MLGLNPLAYMLSRLINIALYIFDTSKTIFMIRVATSYDYFIVCVCVFLMGILLSNVVMISLIECESLILITMKYILLKLSPLFHRYDLVGGIFILDNGHFSFTIWMVL